MKKSSRPNPGIKITSEEKSAMRYRVKRIVKAWREDYQYSTVLSSTISALANIAFTIFNGVLGIVYHSLWNGVICIYYMLLTFIRGILILAQRSEMQHEQSIEKRRQRKIYIGTHLLLLLMDISMIAPIAVMVKGERSYSYGLIPAIAMAAYTIYRITMAIIHFRKSRKSDNLLVSELRMIKLSDALLALLTLQNSLITVKGGMNDKMLILSSWTGAVIYATIVIITIRSFMKLNKES